jgi:hypothetical protein
MHALLGEVREVDELFLDRQPQYEPFRPQPQAEEERDVYCKTLT